MSRVDKRLLKVGDLIRTNPVQGYWGCAVVLTECEKAQEFNSMSHVAITPVIYTYEFGLESLNTGKLSVLVIERAARTDDGTDVPIRHELCTGIYSRKVDARTVVIGNTDVSELHEGALEFKIGDGSGNGWPLCGPIRESLGYEAVHAWRAVHDRKRWLSDIDAAHRSHEEMLIRLEKKHRGT